MIFAFHFVNHYTTHLYNMSRGGRGGGFGRGGGGGGPQSGAMQLVSFDLLKDLGSGNLFNVNTALFPVSESCIPHEIVLLTDITIGNGCPYPSQTHIE